MPAMPPAAVGFGFGRFRVSGIFGDRFTKNPVKGGVESQAIASHHQDARNRRANVSHGGIAMLGMVHFLMPAADRAFQHEAS